MTPEQQLLLACARTSPVDKERLGTLPTLDWSAVLELARYHGLKPLLYKHLGNDAAVPASVRGSLREHYRANSVHNLLLSGELLSLLAGLAGQDITAIPYKGPVLAASAYGTLSLREFNDLDILLKPRDAARAQAYLERRGYRWREQGRFDQGGYHRSFVHPETGYIVELHWGVQRAYFGRLDLALWENLETTRLLGRELRCLSAETTLLLLCVHGAKHHWQGLNWLCDVAEHLRAHPDLDWQRLRERARRVGAAKMLGFGVTLARDLLNAPVPVQVQAAFKLEPNLLRLQARVEQWLFAPELAPASLPGKHRFQLALRERRGDKWRIYRRLLHLSLKPTGEEAARWPVPAPLRFVYYLFRPLRLLLKYGAARLNGDGLFLLTSRQQTSNARRTSRPPEPPA